MTGWIVRIKATKKDSQGLYGRADSSLYKRPSRELLNVKFAKFDRVQRISEATVWSDSSP